MSIDWNFIIDNMPSYAEAAGLTLKLGFIGIILSIIIGLVCSIILYFKVKILEKIVQAYIELSRNTPLLVQIFFLYFGLPKLGLKMSETTCAVIGLAFLGGSYMAEAFRSGLEAVSKSQIESGISIGLSKTQLIRYVIIPQVIFNKYAFNKCKFYIPFKGDFHTWSYINNRSDKFNKGSYRNVL